jgi:hypothetical protein
MIASTAVSTMRTSMESTIFLFLSHSVSNFSRLRRTNALLCEVD